MKTGLVLSGGGSRGAWQAGAWETLWEAGIRPDYVVGTSIGALNGALIASGATPAQLRAAWQQAPQRMLRRRWDWWRLWRWNGFLDPTPLRRFVERNVDLRALRASPTEYQVTAVDIDSGRWRVWDKEEVAVEHLMATMALPPAFAPVRIDGERCVDGGIIQNLPLWEATKAGCDTVYALLHDPIGPHPVTPPRRLREVVWRMSDIVWHGRVQNDLMLLRERVGPARDVPDAFRFLPIAPEPALGNDMLRLLPGQAESFYQAGRRRAATLLAEAGRHDAPPVWASGPEAISLQQGGSS